MAKYNAFLDIVKERPDWSIKSKPVCPFCKSTNVKKGGGVTTLVGGKYNHIWNECECRKCHEKFTLETKERGRLLKPMRWYTKKGKILRGIPACFECYIYTCKKCNGNVVRKYVRLDSNEPVEILSSGTDDNGVWCNKYRIIFRCESCGAEVESENDNYVPNPPKEMSYEEKVIEAKKQAKKKKVLGLRLGFKIKENIGVAIINDYAIAKVEVEK